VRPAGRFVAWLLLLGCLQSPCAAAPKTVVAIQPLGKVDGADVERVRAGITSLYDVEVAILPARALPTEAIFKPRSRYRAEKLLDFLLSIPPGAADKTVGLTQEDISTTKGSHEDWGIFGLGLVGGRVCVVSSFRLHKGPAIPELFGARLVKVVNHELGHAFGLDHCATPGCLMEDAAGSIQTVDRESGALCPSCRARLGALLKPAAPGAKAGA